MADLEAFMRARKRRESVTTHEVHEVVADLPAEVQQAIGDLRARLAEMERKQRELDAILNDPTPVRIMTG